MPSYRPSYKANATLPSGANARKIFSIGQSNIDGTSQIVVPNQNVPHRIRELNDHVGRGLGTYDRLGSYFHDQADGGGGYVKKKGYQTQCGLDLTAAGKSPFFATVGRYGSPISYFGAGQPGDTILREELAQLVIDLGASNWHVVIIWGESDANAAATSAAWQTNLTALAAVIRSYLVGSRAYVAQLNAAYANGAASPNDVNWPAAVRTGNTNFVAADGNAELLNCDAFGYVSPHYDDPGLNSIGSLVSTRVLVNQP